MPTNVVAKKGTAFAKPSIIPMAMAEYRTVQKLKTP